MSINTDMYAVVVTGYAERHFIKGFQKKYPGYAWSKTLDTIRFMLQRADGLRDTDRAEIIHTVGNKHIIKGNFAVFGTKESPKGAGNRYIAFVDDTTCICEILLVYGKNDIVWKRETVWWQGLICENFPEIMGIFDCGFREN